DGHLDALQGGAARLGLVVELLGAGFVLGALGLELGQVGLGGRHGLALGNQEVAAVARLDGDLVTELAEVLFRSQEDELHGGAPRSLAGGWPCSEGSLSELMGRGPSPLPSPASGRGGNGIARWATRSLGVVVVGVRDQGQETRALDGGGELALVLRLGAGHARRDDLAGLGDVLAQGVEILVVGLLDALGGELGELAAAEELGHVAAPGGRDQAASSSEDFSSLPSSSPSDLASERPSPSSSRRRRSPRSGLSPFSSLNFMISDCSVSGPSRLITRWRRIASLKRKVSTSSLSTSWLASMLSST